MSFVCEIMGMVYFLALRIHFLSCNCSPPFFKIMSSNNYCEYQWKQRNPLCIMVKSHKLLLFTFSHHYIRALRCHLLSMIASLKSMRESCCTRSHVSWGWIIPLPLELLEKRLIKLQKTICMYVLNLHVAISNHCQRVCLPTS